MRKETPTTKARKQASSDRRMARERHAAEVEKLAKVICVMLGHDPETLFVAAQFGTREIKKPLWTRYKRSACQRLFIRDKENTQ